MFDLFHKAGIADADVARLANVSRAAVHGWRHKGATPNQWLQPRIQKILDAVRSAVDAGDLPVSKNLTQRERPDANIAVITAHLKKLRNQAPTA